MDYDEFLKMIQKPIDGKHNNLTEIGRVAFFCYQLSVRVDTLEKENKKLEKRLDNLRNLVIRLEDFTGKSGGI